MLSFVRVFRYVIDRIGPEPLSKGYDIRISIHKILAQLPRFLDNFLKLLFLLLVLRHAPLPIFQQCILSLYHC